MVGGDGRENWRKGAEKRGVGPANNKTRLIGGSTGGLGGRRGPRPVKSMFLLCLWSSSKGREWENKLQKVSCFFFSKEEIPRKGLVRVSGKE